MTIKLGNQLLAKVQAEMAENISAIKKQLVEWLERPESGGVDITVEKFRELGGGLALLRQEEVSKLVDALVEGLNYLNREVSAGHLSEDDLRFHEIGAELAAGLLIVEDYVDHLAAIRPLEREAVSVAHGALTDLLANKEAAGFSQRPTITKETYRALTNQINELFETNKHQIDQQVRAPDENFNIHSLKNSNGDLIRVFELLNLSSPRLLLSKVNEMIQPNLSEGQWVEIAEAMLLVEKSLLQLEDDGGRRVNLAEARDEQIKHSRQLEVHGVIRATSEMALDYFAGVRKDVVSQEKLSQSQHWEKSAYMLAQYAPIFQLLGLTELAEQLNKLGLCYGQLSLQDDATAARVYAPVVDSLVAIEQILSDLKEAAELQDGKAMAFLQRAIGDFTSQMAPGAEAENLYRSFIQRAMHSDSIHEEESSLDMGEFLSDLDSLEVPEMEAVIEDLNEEGDGEEEKAAGKDSFGDVLADFGNISFGLAGGEGGEAAKVSGNAGPVSLEMSLDALDSLDNYKQGSASPVGKTNIAPVEIGVPEGSAAADESSAGPAAEVSTADKVEVKGLFGSLKGALSNLVSGDGREEGEAKGEAVATGAEPTEGAASASEEKELALDSLALDSLAQEPLPAEEAAAPTVAAGEAPEVAVDSMAAGEDSLAKLDFSLADDGAAEAMAAAATSADGSTDSSLIKDSSEFSLAEGSQDSSEFSLVEEPEAPANAAAVGATVAASPAAVPAAVPIVKYFAAKSMDEVEAVAVPAAKADFSAQMDGEVIDEEIREFFMEEFNELIDTLNRIYPQWREKPNDGELTTDVRRAFHTLKGSGRTVGYQYLGEFAWQNERLLNGVNEGIFANNSVIQDTIGDSIDLLNVLHGQDSFSEPKGALLAQAYAAEQLRDSLAKNPYVSDAQLQGFAQQFRLGAGGALGAADATTAVNVAQTPATAAVADNLSVSFGEAKGAAEAVPVQLADISETLGDALSAENFRKIVEAIKVAEDAAYDVNNPAFNTLSAVISSHWENRESLKNEKVRDEVAHKLTEALDNYPELPVLQALLNQVAQQYMDFGREEGLSIAENSKFARLTPNDEELAVQEEPDFHGENSGGGLDFTLADEETAPPEAAESSAVVEANESGLDFSLADDEATVGEELAAVSEEPAVRQATSAGGGLDFSLADDEAAVGEELAAVSEESAIQQTTPASGGLDFSNLSLMEESKPAEEAAPGPLEPMATAPANAQPPSSAVSLDDFSLDSFAPATANASDSSAGGAGLSSAQLEQIGEQLRGQLADRVDELAKERLNHSATSGAAASLAVAPTAGAGLDEDSFNRMLGTLKTLLAGGEANAAVENALAATIGRRWGQHEALQREDGRQQLADRLSASLGNMEAERLADILGRAVGAQQTGQEETINIHTSASPVGKNTGEMAPSVEQPGIDREGVALPEGFAAPTYRRIANTLRGTLSSGTFDENMALALAKVIQKQIEPANREKLDSLQAALGNQFAEEGLHSETMLAEVFQHLARLVGPTAGAANFSVPLQGGFIDETRTPAAAVGAGANGFIDELNTPVDEATEASGDDLEISGFPEEEERTAGFSLGNSGDFLQDSFGLATTSETKAADDAAATSSAASSSGDFLQDSFGLATTSDSKATDDAAATSSAASSSGDFLQDSFGLATAPETKAADDAAATSSAASSSGDFLQDSFGLATAPDSEATDDAAATSSASSSGDFLQDSFGLATTSETKATDDAAATSSANFKGEITNNSEMEIADHGEAAEAGLALAEGQVGAPTAAGEFTTIDFEPTTTVDFEPATATDVEPTTAADVDPATAADVEPTPQFELDLDFSRGQKGDSGPKAADADDKDVSPSTYEAPSSSLSNLASLGIDISEINEDASGFKKKPDPYEALANFSFSPVEGKREETDEGQIIKVRVSDDENAAELVTPPAADSAAAALPSEMVNGEVATEARGEDSTAGDSSALEKAVAGETAETELDFIDGVEVAVAEDGEEATPMVIPVADEDLNGDELAKGQEQLAELEKKKVQPIIAPLSSLSASSLPSQVAQGNWAADKGGPIITNATNAKSRLDQELSALQNNSTVVRNVVIDRGSHFLRAVDRFENLSQMVESNQNGELVDDLLDSIYDIEDSLDSAETPGWVWNVLGTIEELLNSYKESGEQISYGMANSLRQSANIIENYQESSEQEAIDNINELMASHRAKQRRPGQAKETPKAPEGMPAMASSHLLGQNVPDPNWGTLLAQTFMDEAQMLFGRSQNKSEQWELDREQTRHLDSIRRDMHTIKGTARMAGYLAIGDLAHSVESLIDSVVTGYIPSSSKVGKTLTNALWNGTEMLESIREGYLPQPNPQVMNNISACLNMPLPYTGFGVNPSLFDEGEFREIDGATPTDNPYETFRESRGEGAPVDGETNGGGLGYAGADASGVNSEPRESGVLDSAGVSADEVNSKVAGTEVSLNAVSSDEISSNQPVSVSDGSVTNEIATKESIQQLAPQRPVLSKGGEWNSELRGGGKGPHSDIPHAQGHGYLHTREALPSMYNLETLDSSNRSVETGSFDSSEELALSPLGKGLNNLNYGETLTQGEVAPPQDLAIESKDPTEPQPATEKNEGLAEDKAEVALKVRYLADDENIDPDILDIFKDEAQELLATSSKLLGGPLDSKEKIHELQRAMHTLKGSSRMAGLTAIGDVSHWMESIVEKMADMGKEQAAKTHELLTVALETQYSMFDSVQRDEFPQETPELLESLEHFAQTGELRLPVRSEEKTPVAMKKAPELSFAATDLHTGEALPSMDKSIASDGDKVDRDIGNTSVNSGLELVPEKHSSQEAFAELSEKAYRSQQIATEMPANVIEEKKFSDQRAQLQADKDRKAREKIEVERRQKVLKKENNGDLSRFVRVDADLLDEMIAMLGESAIMRSRMENVTAASEYNLNELTRLATRIADQVRRFDNETEAQMRSRRDSISVDDEHFDPLEMDRFSELQQLSRQLAEAIDDLKNIQETLNQDNTILRNLTIQQGDVQRDLQDRLLTTQLMRFDIHEPRLRRLIKQTASSIGKEVNFVLEGGEVELERRLLEDLLPSLEHMIRNSIAHGIEMPERRRQAGKPEAGTIKVAVSLRTSEISVRVIDDGAGIDYDKIRAKAAAKGWLDPERANDESYLNSLMMRSGFSTAENLSQLSGRGVGMDVVHEMLKQRRGQIQAYSIKNKGTEFDISMPFSMSIAEVLLVEIAGQTFAAPMSSITAVTQIEREELLRSAAGETIFHRYQDVDYRLFILGQYFKPDQYAYESDELRAPVLLIHTGLEAVAFHVDKILNRMEIIVKNVNRQVLNIPGISGATILGDGRVAPVLEVLDLARRINDLEVAAPTAPAEATEEVEVSKNVLVVDDSVTMRKVSTRLLERNHYTVMTAKDGLDAIEVLKSYTPDVILLDIEMPNMDGFEFASHVRQLEDRRLRNVPIVMITSRTGDKHRERADAIGVQGYLGKPYREDVLLETLGNLLEKK